MNNEDREASTVYESPVDIYRELVDESEESWLYGLVAFAVIQEQKIEWIKHHSAIEGREPNPEEIKQWYRGQPSSALLRAKGTAENALQVYSSDIEDEIIEAHKAEIEQSIVVGEIRDLKRFWPQFGTSVASGVVSSFIFALLLILLATILLNDTSPEVLVEKAKVRLEVIDNGKESRSDE